MRRYSISSPPKPAIGDFKSETARQSVQPIEWVVLTSVDDAQKGQNHLKRDLIALEGLNIAPLSYLILK
jgi:hypothetical protein